jgi:hypothetical protein
MNWAAVLGFLLVGILVPADVAQAQLPTSGLMILRDSLYDVDSITTHQYDPPDVYAAWWIEVQVCVGLRSQKNARRDFAWIAVPGHGFMVKGSGPYIGYAAVERSNFLILAKYTTNKRLVMHEMAHALTWENFRTTGHREEWWSRCELIG